MNLFVLRKPQDFYWGFLYKKLFKEVGIFKFLQLLFNVFPVKLKIIFKQKKLMNKKWPFASPDHLMDQRICDLREEYGIKILTPDERKVKKPLIWSGTIKN